jgi:hypothetical protein
MGWTSGQQMSFAHTLNLQIKWLKIYIKQDEWSSSAGLVLLQ